jgi:hypothetical protein
MDPTDMDPAPQHCIFFLAKKIYVWLESSRVMGLMEEADQDVQPWSNADLMLTLLTALRIQDNYLGIIN